MSLFLKLMAGSQGAGRESDKLTAKMALGLEGERQYFESPEIVKYVNSLRPSELQQLNEGFLLMKSGTRVTGSYIKKTDKGKRLYGYLNFVKGRGPRGIKIILEANMEKFIDDYVDELFSVDFTLEELYNEAVNV